VPAFFKRNMPVSDHRNWFS